jgi:predicted DNA-binding transcriptional regulator AlpA
MGDNLWKVPELAAYIGTSVENTYYLIAHDRIPGIVRIGPRSIRIDPEAIKDWVGQGGYAGVAS